MINNRVAVVEGVDGSAFLAPWGGVPPGLSNATAMCNNIYGDALQGVYDNMMLAENPVGGGNISMA